MKPGTYGSGITFVNAVMQEIWTQEAFGELRSESFLSKIKQCVVAWVDPNIEVRVWCDSVPQMIAAAHVVEDLIIKVAKEMNDPRVSSTIIKDKIDDDALMTVTYELSNGSAVVLGLKALEKKVKKAWEKE